MKLILYFSSICQGIPHLTALYTPRYESIHVFIQFIRIIYAKEMNGFLKIQWTPSVSGLIRTVCILFLCGLVRPPHQGMFIKEKTTEFMPETAHAPLTRKCNSLCASLLLMELQNLQHLSWLTACLHETTFCIRSQEPLTLAVWIIKLLNETCSDVHLRPCFYPASNNFHMFTVGIKWSKSGQVAKVENCNITDLQSPPDSFY